MVRRVVDRLNNLTAGNPLQLASIAKAIEQSAGERIKVIFRPIAREVLGRYAPAVLLTQRMEISGPGLDDPFHGYEHFVYHVSDDDDAVASRFHIAHELGHILLHRPYSDANQEARYYLPVEGTVADMYAVEYRPEEEMEADLFAAVLHHQRPAPLRPDVFHELCLRSAAELNEMGVFRSTLPEVLRDVRDCRVLG